MRISLFFFFLFAFCLRANGQNDLANCRITFKMGIGKSHSDTLVIRQLDIYKLMVYFSFTNSTRSDIIVSEEPCVTEEASSLYNWMRGLPSPEIYLHLSLYQSTTHISLWPYTNYDYHRVSVYPDNYKLPVYPVRIGIGKTFTMGCPYSTSLVNLAPGIYEVYGWLQQPLADGGYYVKQAANKMVLRILP